MHSTGTVTVNGQSLFYVVQGNGRPVVLLHGNGGSSYDLQPTARVLEDNGYQVYSVDSRGQGANTPVSEYHYADMAEDIYQFIQVQGLVHPTVFGYSDGGNVALQMEVNHPGTCGIIVTSGSNIFPDGVGYGVIDGFKAMAPDIPPLVQMMIDEPVMTFGQMRQISCPALICAGEHDLILESHTREIAASIPQGETCIVDGADHTSHIMHSDRMGHILVRYLRQKDY